MPHYTYCYTNKKGERDEITISCNDNFTGDVTISPVDMIPFDETKDYGETKFPAAALAAFIYAFLKDNLERDSDKIIRLLTHLPKPKGDII